MIVSSVFAASSVDRGSKPASRQTNDYEIGIYCLSTNHATFRSKSKDWLAHNQENVS